MQTLIKAIMQKSEVKEFMSAHPVHKATYKAFEKHFEAGLTLEDLPFMVFTRQKEAKLKIKKAA